MGNKVAAIRHCFTSLTSHVLIIGNSGAGKTTILYQLKLHELVNAIPTAGFNLESVTYRGVVFTFWDVSWGWPTDMWRHYYAQKDAIVFVIRTGHQQALWEDIEIMRKVIQSAENKDRMFLVLINRSKDEKSCLEMYRQRLMKLSEEYQLHSMECCAITGQGLGALIDYLWAAKSKTKA